MDISKLLLIFLSLTYSEDLNMMMDVNILQETELY